jgi:integrase
MRLAGRHRRRNRPRPCAPRAAAAGVGAAALQARAGHADLATTQRYIDLAGVAFRDEALIAEQRMFGVESGVETQPTPTPETAI